MRMAPCGARRMLSGGELTGDVVRLPSVPDCGCCGCSHDRFCVRRRSGLFVQDLALMFSTSSPNAGQRGGFNAYFLSSAAGRGLLAVSTVAAVLVGAASVSGADVVSSAFASETTSLTTDIGLGAALVVALMAIGLGVRLLVKWAKRATSRLSPVVRWGSGGC